MSEEKNSDIFLRPRFIIDSEESESDLMNRFIGNLNSGDCKYCCKIVENHIFIEVPSDEDHFWSPQLHVEVVEGKKSTSEIKGLFGPKPQVWTLFMFLHFAIGILFLVFVTMLYVRWTLNESLIFSGIMVVALPVVWIVLYVFGRLGRRKGESQTEELHRFLTNTLKN
jgi:ABC-type multidrug transport system fused ATPase/permease subunit